MSEQEPKAHQEETEREETIEDLDASEQESGDVKGGQQQSNETDWEFRKESE